MSILSLSANNGKQKPVNRKAAYYASVERPASIAPITDTMPTCLSMWPVWICWDLERVEGKWKKIPKNPIGNGNARTNDPSTWGLLEDAVAKMRANDYAGIAIVLTRDRSIMPVDMVGVDLDDCRDPDTGIIDAWALDIIRDLSTYCEVSPSGTGIKMLCTAQWPDESSPPCGRNFGEQKIEIYREKYWTMTGHHAPGTPAEIEQRDAPVAALWQRCVDADRAAKATRTTSSSLTLVATGSTITDDDRHAKYLSKCTPAIEGKNGSADLMGTIRKFIGAFPEVDADTAMRAISSYYNPQCVPPWSEKELRHAVDNIYSRETLNPKVITRTVPDVASIDPIDMPLPPPPEWPILRPEAMHGIVGDIVQTIAPESEADPVAILIQLLTSAGSAIGRTVHARVEGDCHYTNLFTATVGKSGHGRKGTSWGRTQQAMSIADPDWLKNCLASGMSSGEGVIARVRDRRTEEGDDGEGKIIDEGVRDKRLLVVETEFGQVLRNLKRDSNTLSAIIRQAWDRGSLSTLTKHATTATGAHISVIAHVTRPELAKYIEDVDLFNGFANRFLWVLTKRSKLLPEGGRRLDLEPLGASLRDAIGLARRTEEVSRDDETRELWASVYPRLTAGRPGLAGIVTSRAEAQVLRLAVLYCALDGFDIIMPCHLEAALALWDYCDASARIIFGDDERMDPTAKAILTMLSVAGDSGMTRTDISHGLGKNVPSAKIVQSLTRLRDTERIKSMTVSSGGRPAERWHIVQ